MNRMISEAGSSLHFLHWLHGAVQRLLFSTMKVTKRMKKMIYLLAFTSFTGFMVRFNDCFFPP